MQNEQTGKFANPNLLDLVKIFMMRLVSALETQEHSKVQATQQPKRSYAKYGPTVSLSVLSM